jgi:hypothetical protein
VVVDDNRGLAAALRAELTGTAAAAADDTGAPTWHFDGPVDRDAVMAEIHQRSAAARGIKSRRGTAGAPSTAPAASAALPLRRLRPVPPPPATSARPGVSTVKKAIRRVIAWEVDPLREQLVRLQQASLQAAETADARLDAQEHDVHEAEPGQGTDPS